MSAQVDDEFANTDTGAGDEFDLRDFELSDENGDAE